MAVIELAEVIKRPREIVWAVVSDPLGALDWVSTAVERRFAAREVVEKGTVTRHVDRFLGRRIETTWEIVHLEAPIRLVARTITAPVAMEFEYELAERGHDTQVALNITTESDLGGLFGRLADSLVIGMVRRSLQADLTNLKELLEAGELG